MDFLQELSSRTDEIEAILRSYLPREEGYQKRIMEAMDYSLLAGGKRLRPLLMQETYRMFGGASKVVEPFMAAMEMIHTYSLVHDDLPAMDNDAYRRGKETTHVRFGEAMGILAGDALLTFAFETAAKAFALEPGNERAERALFVLAEKAGIYGMLGGQVVDVETEKDASKVMTKEKLDFIYRMKTSALIEASMEIGAILAGADRQEIAVIEAAAGKLGLAFQIRDDILDETGTLAVLGKPIGSDRRNEKVTYVTLFGQQEASDEVGRLSNEAVELLHSLKRQDGFLEQLFLYLIHREK